MASISASSSVNCRNCTHSGVPSPCIQTSSDGSCPRCKRIVCRYERRMSSMESMSVPSRSKRNVERCTPEGNFDGRKRHAQFRNRPHAARRRHPAGADGASLPAPHPRAARRGRLPMPRRVVTILDGESMINGAAAIVAYRVAVAAVVTGAFSLMGAAGRFVVVGTGGVLVGLAVGWLLAAVRRRIHDPEVENTISLLSGYAAYLPAEHFGVSGILAVVAMGIYLGRVGPRFVAADTRVQNAGMWDVVVFVLEGLIFILTGLALRPIVEGLTGAAALELARAAVLVSLAVVIARLLWVYFAGNFRWLLGPRLRPREPRPRWQVLTVVGWAGLRGGDTLILAAAIPTVTATGMPFPGRDAIIALSYGVILVTLLGQGFTLAPLMRRLGVRETGEEEEREEIAARLRASEAALARLEELASEPWMHQGALSHTRDRYRLRTRHLRGHADGVLETPIEAKSIAHLRLARELLAAERQELLRMRDNGAISDAVMRRVQQELDYEELLLHHE